MPRSWPILGGDVNGSELPPAMVHAAQRVDARVLDAYAMLSRLLPPAAVDGADRRLRGRMVSTRYKGFAYDDVHLMCSVNREVLTLMLNSLCEPSELGEG